jgi:hypothetical protein
VVEQHNIVEVASLEVLDNNLPAQGKVKEETAIK